MSVGSKQGISVEPPNAAYTTGHQARFAVGESILYSTETPVSFIVMDGGGEKGREAGEKSCECIRS